MLLLLLLLLSVCSCCFAFAAIAVAFVARMGVAVEAVVQLIPIKQLFLVIIDNGQIAVAGSRRAKRTCW